MRTPFINSRAMALTLALEARDDEAPARAAPRPPSGTASRAGRARTAEVVQLDRRPSGVRSPVSAPWPGPGRRRLLGRHQDPQDRVDQDLAAGDDQEQQDEEEPGGPRGRGRNGGRVLRRHRPGPAGHATGPVRAGRSCGGCRSWWCTSFRWWSGPFPDLSTVRRRTRPRHIGCRPDSPPGPGPAASGSGHGGGAAGPRRPRAPRRRAPAGPIAGARGRYGCRSSRGGPWWPSPGGRRPAGRRARANQSCTNVAPLRQGSGVSLVKYMTLPDSSSTPMEPADSEALSFWPALNLPTSIVPSRRVRDRSQAQSREVKRFNRRVSSR